MATWNTIQNTEIAVDAPVTSQLVTKMRDNLDAVTEGASGAPKNTNESLESFTRSASAGDTISIANTTHIALTGNNGFYDIMHGVIQKAGNYRIIVQQYILSAADQGFSSHFIITKNTTDILTAPNHSGAFGYFQEQTIDHTFASGDVYKIRYKEGRTSNSVKHLFIVNVQTNSASDSPSKVTLMANL